MVVTLVRLKLAIQRHQRGSSAVGQVAALWGRWLVAFVLGVAAGAGVRELDLLGADAAVLGVLLLVFLGWVVLPLVVPGLADSTVDPARLELFPVSPGEQVAGLLAAGLVAPTALFTFLVAVGGAALPGEAWWARIGAVLAALVFTAICVAASRALQAWVAGALRTRHGRDLVYLVAGGFSLAVVLVSQDPQRLTAALAGGTDAIVDVLSWLPTGATGRALTALRDGAAPAAVGFVVLSIGWTVLFALAWTAALRRRLDGASPALRPRRRERSDVDLDLLVEPLRSFRPTPARAAMAQQLRYYFARSPRASQMVLAGVVGGAFVGHATTASNDLVVGAMVFAALMGTQLGSATFGFDDHGVAWLLQSGAPMRAVVVGKTLAAAATTSAGVVGFVIVEAAIRQSWDLAVPAGLVGMGTTASAAGIGAMIGVLGPFNQERPTGGRLRLLGSMIAGIAIMFTVPLLIGWSLDTAGLPTSSPVGAATAMAIGVAAGWAVTALAGRRAAADPFRITEALGVT